MSIASDFLDSNANNKERLEKSSVFTQNDKLDGIFLMNYSTVVETKKTGSVLFTAYFFEALNQC